MDRHADRAAALASLRARWGSAAPRPALEVFGALAAAPLPAEAGAVPVLSGDRPEALPGSAPARPSLVPLPGGAAPGSAPARPLPGEAAGDRGRVISTGFPDLDALLANGGLPRAGTVALRGAGSSGATTLALRAVAEAQAGGALVAWVDLARSLDPVEAVARGVRLEWLAVLAPGSLDEALAMAGSLLQGRAVDVLVLDLAVASSPAAGRSSVVAAGGSPAAVSPAVAAVSPAVAAGGSSPAGPRSSDRGVARPPDLADRLARLVAFARRAGSLLLVLEPPDPPAPLRAGLEIAGLRLELRRRGWIRLGREVVGQQTEVRVARDHHGAPDRRTALRLLYAEGGPRDRCLARDELLAEELAVGDFSRTAGPPPALPDQRTPPEHQGSTDAPPPPRLAPSRPSARPEARSLDPRRRAADPRRAAVG